MVRSFGALLNGWICWFGFLNSLWHRSDSATEPFCLIFDKCNYHSFTTLPTTTDLTITDFRDRRKSVGRLRRTHPNTCRIRHYRHHHPPSRNRGLTVIWLGFSSNCLDPSQPSCHWITSKRTVVNRSRLPYTASPRVSESCGAVLFSSHGISCWKPPPHSYRGSLRLEWKLQHILVHSIGVSERFPLV